MKKFHWSLVIVTLVLASLILGACGAISPAITASPEAARLAGGGGAAIVNGQASEGVVVSATGTASADPEVAEITFGVELQGQDPEQLVSDAAGKMDAAMAATTAFGIIEDKTRTLNYNLWVETVYDRETGRPTDDVIYHLSHQVQVTTDKIDSVGELLAGVVDAGANAVSGVSFTVEDQSALIEKARDAALADAQARAEHIAEQLGIDLGKPVLVTETGGNFPVAADYGIGGGGAMMEAAAPRVEPGSFSVSVGVQIVYSIR
jgi:uncharacterized protein